MRAGVGKSLTVALLCRLFSEDGYRVAPFKALNLTNVTYKDDEGREFGYSQVLQAIVAGIKPDYRMNPFTPKPLGKGRFELILEGKQVETYKSSSAIIAPLKEGFRKLLSEETSYERVRKSVKRCLDSLMEEYEVVCIEGSGPSKLKGLGIFSKYLDLPNMETARLASAPAILVGGSADSIKATYDYLSEDERRFVKGAILNRFTYSSLEREFTEKMGVPKRLFDYGLRRVEEEWLKPTGIKIVGNIPYLEELHGLPDLDPLFSDKRIDLNLWREVLPKIARKVRKEAKMKEIYKIMGI